MTDHKILNTVFRTTTAFILIGGLITAPLSTAATEISYLSTEFHAAVEQVADSFKDELMLKLAETIRPPAALRVNLVIATGPMGNVVEQEQLVSSHTANTSRGDDT